MTMQTRRRERFILAVLALVVLGIYLFVSAPPKLSQTQESSGLNMPVERFFSLLDAENASIRTLYTAEIVGPGQRNGLKFDEAWKQGEVLAGPLPALFLRETSSMLQRDVEGVNLFLGSDYPIVTANAFKGLQVDYFKKVRAEGKPQFFQDPSTRLYTAMFPDVASAKPCVTCHNDHPQTPKKDWLLNDIMGATTWLYPRSSVPLEDVLSTLQALRKAAVSTYAMYLEKIQKLPASEQPEIGTRWPREGHFLPNIETFAKAVAARNSAHTLGQLMTERGVNRP
jgi:adenylate cyclase